MKSKYSGYTFIELLIYAGLVTLIVGAFLTASYNLITSSQHDRERLALQENERFIIHRINQSLYGATISQITPSNGSSSSLTIQKSCSDLIRLELVNNALVLRRNSNGDCSITAADQNYPLTNSHATVSNVLFEAKQINSQPAIRFQSTLTNQNITRTIDTVYYLK